MIDTQKIRERSIVPGSHQIPVIQMLCDEVDEARERVRELEAELEYVATYYKICGQYRPYNQTKELSARAQRVLAEREQKP